MQTPTDASPNPSPPGTGARAAEAPLLALRAIHHQWRKAPAPVLDEVTLGLHRGEVTWIGGRNGVGKTTLLRVAGGILLPQRGTVTLDGLTPSSRGRHYQARIGYLSAGDRGLHARLNVTQHLDYWARLAYVPREARSPAVAGAITDFGLEQYSHHRVDRLSQGWRQRVRLAMAFLHRPDVLLLDEPRNSLDDEGYAVLNTQVRAAAERGAAVLWCSPRDEDGVIEFDREYTIVAARLQEAS
jgi:ABC-type multidrug transport system ATPase subunit